MPVWYPSLQLDAVVTSIESQEPMLGSWPPKLDRLGPTCVFLEALIDPLEKNGWNMVKQPIFFQKKKIWNPLYLRKEHV